MLSANEVAVITNDSEDGGNGGKVAENTAAAPDPRGPAATVAFTQTGESAASLLAQTCTDALMLLAKPQTDARRGAA